MARDADYHDLYSEDDATGRPWRERQLDQWEALIRQRRRLATRRRRAGFQPDLSSPDAYAASVEPQRERLRSLLGWPLSPAATTRELGELTATTTYVGEDRLATIHRVEIQVLAGMSLYALLFLPHGEGPHPVCICQHGGGGTPELVSWASNTANYNHLTHRILEHGVACFVPQMTLWQPVWGPEIPRLKIDTRLKHLGSSMHAVELHKLQRGLDWVLARPDIDASRVGMAGLSYGGFFTLFNAALDPRIRVAVSSCFFNSRYRYDWQDWTWKDAANQLLDGEIASIVCPRALYIEVGRTDSLFTPGGAVAEARPVRERYDALDLADRFHFEVFEGGHEMAWEPDWVPFLLRHLGVEPRA